MFEELAMNEATAQLLTASWVVATRRQYILVMRRWAGHCEKEAINARQPTLRKGIEYLQKLFSEGVAKTTINTVKSMLSTFVTVGGRPFGEHPLVSRLLNGVGNLKPSLPRYEEIWIPNHSWKTSRAETRWSN